jgi:hypothetical protein
MQKNMIDRFSEIIDEVWNLVAKMWAYQISISIDTSSPEAGQALKKKSLTRYDEFISENGQHM